MGKGNVIVRKWLNRRRMADLFNGVVFEGEQVVFPEDLEPIETESDVLLTDKKKETKERQRYRDIVMKWNHGIYFAILACENQEKVNYVMPVRNMLYDSLSYNDQIEELWVAHARAGIKPTAEEFISKFLKEDHLIPVITIVFYYGTKEWDASLDLYGMFGIRDNPELEKMIKNYVSNYKINLVNAGNMEDIYRFRTDLQQIFGMLKYRGNKKELLTYLHENESYFRHVDYDTYHAIKEFLHSESILKKTVEIESEKGDIDMCQALEELYQDGINEGLERGKNSGMVAFIELAQELECTKEQTKLKVMEKFGLNEAEAAKKVEEVWK